MKLSEILEGLSKITKGTGKVTDITNEQIAKALSTKRNPLSAEKVAKNRADYLDYYLDKMSEYQMDAAGEGEEEATGEKCIRCRKGTMQPGETMAGPAKKCDHCGYQLARKEK